MSILALSRIRVGATATDKRDAIRQAGALLVDTGCVRPAYVDGMLEREEQMSTYLGNGVAIPHGQYENRDDVIQTGISVLQLPQGIEWEEDETAHLIIGIAATSDEHIGVLSALAEVIEDDAVTALLSRTEDPGVILKHLSASATAGEEA